MLRKKSDFTRNVLTLMTGTTIAQAIPIAISPILTRLYTPEDFGLFALYLGITSILAVIATGRYELAIMLPKSDEDAINIVWLSILITILISIVLFIVIIIFNTQITNLLGNKEISYWLYFMPITILLTGTYQSLNYWFNRKKRYKDLAINRIIQSTTTASSNLGIGFSNVMGNGLILSGILGQLIATATFIKKFLKDDKRNLKQIEKNRMLMLARTYNKFPKLDIPSSLLNVSSHQMISILFNIFFNSTVAGYFYLTQRMLGTPISIVSSAILDVFKEQAAKDYQEFGNAKKIYTNTFKKLFLLSIIPSLILYIYAIEIFTLVFGENWKTAGEYAQILVPMLFIQFISSPLSFMIYIGEKQELNLYSQLLLFILILISFYISGTPKETITYLSFSFSIFYLLQLFISANIAKVLK